MEIKKIRENGNWRTKGQLGKLFTQESEREEIEQNQSNLSKTFGGLNAHFRKKKWDGSRVAAFHVMQYGKKQIDLW